MERCHRGPPPESGDLVVAQGELHPQMSFLPQLIPTGQIPRAFGRPIYLVFPFMPLKVVAGRAGNAIRFSRCQDLAMLQEFHCCT